MLVHRHSHLVSLHLRSLGLRLGLLEHLLHLVRLCGGRGELLLASLHERGGLGVGGAGEQVRALYRGEIRSLRLGGFLRVDGGGSRGGVVHGALDCDGSDVLLLSLLLGEELSLIRLRLRRDEAIGGEVEGANVRLELLLHALALDAGALAGDGSIGGLRTGHDILELGDDVEGGVPGGVPSGVRRCGLGDGHGLCLGSLRLAQLGGGGGQAEADGGGEGRLGVGVERDDADGSDDREGTRGDCEGWAGDGFETSGGRDVEKRGGVTVQGGSRRGGANATGRRVRRTVGDAAARETPIALPWGKKRTWGSTRVVAHRAGGAGRPSDET